MKMGFKPLLILFTTYTYFIYGKKISLLFKVNHYLVWHNAFCVPAFCA